MIKVNINGETKDLKSSISLTETLKSLGYDKGGFAVAINGNFVAISTYDETIIFQDDHIEILSAVQGG